MHETALTPLPLPTPDQREQLLANGRQSGGDHVPVVKFFNPVGIGIWLATELDPDGDTLYGLAQLNGAPEPGSFSLEELATLELPFGMHIERDLFFTGTYPISAYAEAAYETGSITAAIRILSNAAWAKRGEGCRCAFVLAKTRTLSRHVAQTRRLQAQATPRTGGAAALRGHDRRRSA